MPTYETVQKGWIWVVLPVAAVVTIGFSFAIPEPEARLGFWILGGVVAGLAAAFAHLTVRDEGDSLFVGFGPLPVFRRRIAYARITGVEIVRSPLWLGWGVRWWPGKGWAWLIAGRDLVRLQMGKRCFHVGSPEPDQLVAMLEEHIRRR